MPIPLRPLLLSMLLFGAPGLTLAASADEAIRLQIMLQHLDTLETLTSEAAASASASAGERYFFDYPRLNQDLQRVRQGVFDYLHPSRAQPRDPAQLHGDYRRERDEAVQ